MLDSEVQSVHSEAEAFFRHYNDAFNRQDEGALFDCLHFPHAFMNGERGMMVVPTRELFEGMHRQVMGFFQARGWVRTVIDGLKTSLLARNLVLITADVTRCARGESILEQHRILYVLRKADGAWRI